MEETNKTFLFVSFMNIVRPLCYAGIILMRGFWYWNKCFAYIQYIDLFVCLSFLGFPKCTMPHWSKQTQYTLSKLFLNPHINLYWEITAKISLGNTVSSVFLCHPIIHRWFQNTRVTLIMGKTCQGSSYCIVNDLWELVEKFLAAICTSSPVPQRCQD